MRWPRLLVLAALIVFTGLSAPWWLPPLLGYLGSEGPWIETLSNALSILATLGGAAVALWGFLRRPKPTQQEDPVATILAKGRSAAIGGDAQGNLFILGDVHLGSTAARLPGRSGREELRVLTERYLRFVRDRHQYLDLKGFGVNDRMALRLELLDLYVPLSARLELPEGETWDRRAVLLGGRELSDEDAERIGRRLGEPRPVLELLAKNEALIVVGDPGSGKTTLLKTLALLLAAGKGDELGLGDRLPVLVPISAYAKALEEDDLRLDDFVAHYFHSLGIDEAFGAMLKQDLEKGRALLLLDGLDEVRTTRLRLEVMQRIVEFVTYHRQNGNRCVLTSRIVGYREVKTLAAGIEECTLVDFGEQEIRTFVERWTAALERQAQGATRVAELDAEAERRGLLDAIERNTGIGRLAANPLLLTILAVMKRQGVALPDRRVELYDQYVKTLLSTWNRARSLGKPPAHEVDPVATLRVLAPLALWMHEVDPGLGLVKREELRRKLEAIYAERGEEQPEAQARQCLEDVREHTGLLIERGPGEYGFLHLTFEEYLAAVAIALEAQGDPDRLAARVAAKLGEPAWHEVTLLLVGYVGLIQQLDGVAGAVLEKLIASEAGPPGQAVALAGRALLEVGPAGLPPKVRRSVTEALVAAMQGSAVKPTLRREAGLLLGRLGWVPEDLDSFVKIPSGRFLFGEAKEEREIPYGYWIAKYPVTNLQYQRFVADGGYARKELWSAEGWRWRQAEKREQPLTWNEDFENPIFPRVGVSFYEAEAYCGWLSLQPLAIEIPQGYTARLPSEEEWEKAARGVEGREFPWDGSFAVERANTEESGGENKSGIGTTAVCTYPLGESPFGAWDMAGNAWEWLQSRDKTKDYNLKGGSFYFDKRYARCAARGRLVAGLFIDIYGFRVVLSLANS